MFIDESSSPPKRGQTGQPPFFVIAGVIIPESKWHNIAQELQSLKEKPEYKIRGEIKWRYFGKANDDPRNNVRHLDQKQRDCFRDDFFSILTSLKSIQIVACVTRVAAAYTKSFVTDEEDIYHYTYKPVSERFQYFLQDFSRTTGSTTLGLVVADHRGRKQDDRLRRQHQKLVHSTANTTSKYENMVESLFLTPSHHSVGIQFADMVAGAISRRFNSDLDGSGKYFTALESAFRANSRNGDYKGYGLVRFPDEPI